MHIPLPSSARTTRRVGAIAFLTVVESQDGAGLVGGCLVLNPAARPLEFHCTAPVRPNRAQEILYGRTLRPFLYGEQLGLVLLGKLKQAPALVVTDLAPVLAVRPLQDHPVIWLYDPAAADTTPPESEVVELGEHRVAAAVDHESDLEAARDCWQTLGESFDWWEPFGRIREALVEAQRGANRAA